MWPFGKKHPDIGELAAIADEWRVAAGSMDGAPVFISCNAGAKRWAGHPALPVRVGFAIPVKDVRPGELPTPAEHEQLLAVEDQIVGQMKDWTGVFLVTIANPQMRELVFQVAEGTDIGALHQALQQAVSTHEVQCYGQLDPAWDVYKFYLNMAEKGKR